MFNRLVFSIIISFLDKKDWCICAQVSKKWKSMVNRMWPDKISQIRERKLLFLKNYLGYGLSTAELAKSLGLTIAKKTYLPKEITVIINLRKLYIKHSKIDNLVVLPKLKSLEIYDCKVENLDNIFKLTTLETLVLNDIKGVRARYFANLGKLKQLTLIDCIVEGHLNLTHLPLLDKLLLRRSLISSIVGLSGSTNLVNLQINTVPHIEVESLKDLVLLAQLNFISLKRFEPPELPSHFTELEIFGTTIKCMEKLDGSYLVRLSLQLCKNIKNLVLPNLPFLKELNLNGSDAENIEGFAHLDLDNINVSRTKISLNQLLVFTSLTYLTCLGYNVFPSCMHNLSRLRRVTADQDMKVYVCCKRLFWGVKKDFVVSARNFFEANQSLFTDMGFTDDFDINLKNSTFLETLNQFKKNY